MRTAEILEYLQKANARIDEIQWQMADARKRAEATDCPNKKAEIANEIHDMLDEIDRQQSFFLKGGGPELMRKEASNA